MSFYEADGFLAEKMVENRVAIALGFGFFEMGKVRSLHLSAITGNDPVSALGASVCSAFLGIVYMEDTAFFIVSDGV